MDNHTDPNSGASAPAAPRQKDASSYWFARGTKPIIFLIVTLALVGAYLGFTIPIAVFPTTDFPRIIVGVDNGVMPIDQMMVTVTRPIEEAVGGVLGIQDVRSVTSRGSAEVDLFFHWNVNMFQTLQRVNAAIATIRPELPATARITAHRLDFSAFPILGYSLASTTVPQTKLWELATYDIKPLLSSLPGVATVVIQGMQVPEFHIAPDPGKMLVTRTTISDLLTAVDRSNLIESPGLLTHDHQLFLDLVTGQTQNVGEIGHIYVKKDLSGNPLYVHDLATVSPGIAPNYTIVTANRRPAVLINVNRQRRSNTMLVAAEVQAEMQKIEKSLPPGVKVGTFYDQSWIVGESIKSVRDAILIGIILASAVLVIFLGDWGSSFIAGMVIPISILMTFAVLKLLGESFNLMSLGGLAAAVGLIIDDAIVVVENTVLRREAGEDRFEAVAHSLKELTIPLIGSTLTPIVVFLPLIAITGVSGVFFRALAVTVGVALLASLTLALTWTPNLCLYLLRQKPVHAPSPAGGDASPAGSPADGNGRSPEAGAELTSEQVDVRRMMELEEHSMGRTIRRVIRLYDRWFRRALARPWWVAMISAALIPISIFCYNRIGSDLLPKMDEGSFIVDYVTPPGSSLRESNRMITHIMKIIQSVPEVEGTSRRTGLQLGLAAVTEANVGDISVDLKTKRSRSVWSIMNAVRARIERSEPAVSIDVHQKLGDMIGDLTSAPQPIYIELFNPSAQMLKTWAPRVADAIGRISVGGTHPVVDIDNGIDSTTSGPVVVYRVNVAKAAHAGFTPQDVVTEADAMLDGVTASQPVVLNDRPYPLRIRYPAAFRSSLDAMNNMLLVSPTGSLASLGTLASMTELPGQIEILQDHQQRYVAVAARLEGLDMGHGIAAVQRAVAGLHLPSSIRVEYGGLYETQQKSFHDLVMVLFLAIIFVFLVLLFEFKNFSAPIAILVSALLSTAGVMVALYVTGMTFNLSSFMGQIMVIGIVAKNGILILDAEGKFRDAGFDAREAIIQAGRRRLRPIVMTALAAAFGFLPLALAIGSGSQMLQPLAVAVIGGILIAIVLSLFVTPTLYYYLGRDAA